MIGKYVIMCKYIATMIGKYVIMYKYIATMIGNTSSFANTSPE